MLENDGADKLGLDFTVTEELLGGRVHAVELIPNGGSVDVTDSNKQYYVERRLKYVLIERVRDQLFAFLAGLYEVVPPYLLMVFDAEELDYVLSGSDEIDVNDWERDTKYLPDLINHQARKYFWQLVQKMTSEERRRLL